MALEANMAKTTRYDMLVRDGYPEMLERGGKKRCVTSTVDGAELMDRLADKLAEETQNFGTAYDAEDDEKAIGKLADVVEVVYTMLGEYGVSDEAFCRIREARSAMYGTYDRHTLLECIEELDSED